MIKRLAGVKLKLQIKLFPFHPVAIFQTGHVFHCFVSGRWHVVRAGVFEDVLVLKRRINRTAEFLSSSLHHVCVIVVVMRDEDAVDFLNEAILHQLFHTVDHSLIATVEHKSMAVV